MSFCVFNTTIDNRTGNKYRLEESYYQEPLADVYKLQWTIPVINKLLKTNIITGELRRPKTTVVEGRVSKLKLKMRIFENGNDIETYYLSPTSAFIYVAVCVKIDTMQQVFNFKQNFHKITLNTWQYCGKLNNATDIQSIPGDVNLSLVFNFQIFRHNYDCFNTPISQQCVDFGNLLTDSTYSDLIMKSVDGEEFRVHKSVVSIRSNVLKAHFEHNTTESITNIVETTLGTAVLREVLDFIYTGKAQVDENAEELFAAADYYQLDELKSLCEEALYKKLTVDNAVSTLQLAELYTANTLKETALEFIKHGPPHLIIKTEGWANLQSAELIKTISEYIMSDKNDILADALAEVLEKVK